jgi:subtilisin family serine protease
MKRLQNLARAGLLILLLAVHAFAGDQYIVRINPAWVDLIAKIFNLKIDKKLSEDGVYLVTLPKNLAESAIVQALKANSLIQSVERNVSVKLPGLTGFANQGRRRSPYLKGGAPSIPMAGAPRAPYVNQPATGVIHLQEAQRAYGYANSSVQVAVIDTGVDYKHQVLQGVINTQDAKSFVSGIPDASTNQETTPFVDQETTPFVDGAGTIVLNQETTPFVDQETTPFVDQETTPFVDGKYWGHGTMVAGLVHLVAPNARILPLRAFKSDGSGSLADVIEAIEYATKLGNVDVINMSFSAPETSDALDKAIAKAASKGILCVASVGNDNSSKVVVYPANISPVIGVGATTNDNYRASFSNYGSSTDIGAPGVEIMSTYPRDKRGKSRYGIASGTSFSTPLVAGTLALIESVNRRETASEADSDLDKGAGKVKSPEFPAGQLNVLNTVTLGKN